MAQTRAETDLAKDSPISILFGRQLRREHGFLLDRMEKLDKAHQAQEDRMKAIEAIADLMIPAQELITSTTERVQRIEDVNKDFGDRMAGLENAREANKKNSARMEAQLGELSTAVIAIEQRVEQMGSDFKALMKTVVDLQNTTKEQNKHAERLVKKNDQSNVRVLVGRLDAMEALRNDELLRGRSLAHRIAAVERTLDESTSFRDEFVHELARIRKVRNQSMPAVPVSSPDTEERFPSSSTDDQVENRYSPESPLVNVKQRREARFLPRPEEQEAQVVRDVLNVPTPGRQRESSRRITPLPDIHQDSSRRSINRQLFREKSDGANSGRKRKAPPNYELPETRSQTTLKKQKREDAAPRPVVKTPAPRPKATNPRNRAKQAQALQSIKTVPNAKVSDGAAAQRNGTRKKKRREIPQPDDWDTFLRSAN